MVTLSSMISVTASAVTLFTSALGIRRVYQDWCEKSEDPHTTSSEKAQIAFEGFLQATAFISSISSIYSIGSSVAYQNQKKKIDKIYDQWIVESQKTQKYGVCGDVGGETLDVLKQTNEGMRSHLLAYQLANFTLTCTNAVCMTREVAQHLKKETASAKEHKAFLCKTILGRGSLLYITYIPNRIKTCNFELRQSSAIRRSQKGLYWIILTLLRSSNRGNFHAAQNCKF